MASRAGSSKHVVVIGAGVIGLQSAINLLEAGYEVTVVASHLPGDESIDYTSPWAGAQWRTHASYPAEEEQCQWDTDTYRYWDEMLRQGEGEKAGIGRFTSHCYWDSSSNAELAPKDPAAFWWTKVVSSFSVFPASALPPGVGVGIQFVSLTVNPQVYLHYLQTRVSSLGGRVLKTTLPTSEGLPDVLDGLASSIEISQGKETFAFVNATGMGARNLVPDDRMYPTRGQTVTVKGVAERISTRIGDWGISYVLPRSGGVNGQGTTILGGCKEANNWNAKVDDAFTRMILERCSPLAPELLNEDGEFDVLSAQVGFRPSREGGPRVEIERLYRGAGNFTVVHSYGHSGAGYQNSIGSAKKVVRLLQEYDRRNQTTKSQTQARL